MKHLQRPEKPTNISSYLHCVSTDIYFRLCQDYYDEAAEEEEEEEATSADRLEAGAADYEKKPEKKKRFQFDFRLTRIVFKTSLQAALSGQNKYLWTVYR